MFRTDPEAIKEYLGGEWIYPTLRGRSELMLFRRAGQVAMGASLLLALRDPAPRRVRDLADELGVATTYLAKILQGLVHAGLMRGVRGPRGGIRLAVPAEEICQWDVLVAVQPMNQFARCILGWERCSDGEPCPLHESWAPIRTEVEAMLRSKTLRELVTEAQRKGLSLRDASHRGISGER